MRLLGIFSCLIFFLVENFSLTQKNKHVEPGTQDILDLETKRNHNFYTLKRDKREDRDVRSYVSEYELDIEVTLPNSLTTGDLKGFLNRVNSNPILARDGSLNITQVLLTTVCEATHNKMLCSCEDGYSWPPTLCKSYPPCSIPSSNPNCNCIERLPTDDNVDYCSVPTNTLYGLCKINSEFTDEFLNIYSVVYKTYKNDFENALFEAYKAIEGFLSVKVTYIRKGSIVIDYEVRGIHIPLPEVLKATPKAAEVLRAKYPIEKGSFLITDSPVGCTDSSQGFVNENTLVNVPCSDGFAGFMTLICKKGKLEITKEKCISVHLMQFQQNLTASIVEQNLTQVAKNLSELLNRENIIRTAGNLGIIVTILRNISSLSLKNIDSSTMQDFIQTVSYILDFETLANWTLLLKDERDAGSRLLHSVENFSQQLDPDQLPLSISHNFIDWQGVKVSERDSGMDYNVTFNRMGFNITGSVLLPKEQIMKLPTNTPIVSIAYSTLGQLLPNNSDGNALVNGLVMSTIIKDRAQITDVSLTFEKINGSLREPQCVFWDYDGTYWTDTGCHPENETNKVVVCRCTHLTSFSILMSPTTPSDKTLTSITYIGIGISMASLVLCLVIEAVVWRHVTKHKIAFMRHVCIVNIAISLLIADIWFIIASALTQLTQSRFNSNAIENACVAATFFIHFFYLCLFFWMLILGLLILYRTIFVFHDNSKSSMLSITFSLGYLCPLIISVITIASTQPQIGYRRKDACWLNWNDSKSLLAFIIPAFLAVVLNIIIVLVVISKIRRPTIGERPVQEKSTIVQIGRSIVILTPLLGLTWIFGLLTVVYTALAFHIIFAVLNSLQGFFILLCGTLWDSKVLEALLYKFSFSRWSSQQTKNTSQNSSTDPMPKTFNNIFQKKKNCDMSTRASS
ncbi:adhesion G-protein coupled receptor F1-like [Rhinatrema bivittatum]|uniref:adhesion G-protein coupled receptor F1-like n=1 Tax=Rhinatrema bivittatum TaxID=194408 RepID=UPI0011278067|nr:adhesion G-protein coupled receptor F1-like [Rhinatrema bivittatum]